MSLSTNELERYSRQIALREIGVAGQKKLKKARVCIVGVGGLGCVSALQLAAMGVGYLRLVDQDVVDLTNLHRQPLYDTGSIGYPKVEITEKKLKLLNPNVEIEAIPLTVDSTTSESIVKDVDVVIDGLDHFSPRYAINQASLKHKVSYVYGGAIESYGSISTIIPEKTACLECLVGRITDEGLPTCETVGVLPPVLGIVASLQVREAVSLILGEEPALANKLLFCDLNSTNFEIFPVVRSLNCSTCGTQTSTIIPKLRVAQLCGKDSFMVSSRENVLLDMAKVASILGTRFRLKIQAHYGVTFDYTNEVSISLMKTGNMLVKGIKDKHTAIKVYDEIINDLTTAND